MAQSVSNDALWEKLSEVDKKLEKLSEMQKISNLDNEQAFIKPDFQKEKDEIVSKLEKYIQGLGTHCDFHFKAIYKDMEQSNEHMHGVYEVLSGIWTKLQEAEEPSKETPENRMLFFNFKLFKLRKSFLIIGVLGLLVFILTLFCMKQQNDYSILNSEYYRTSFIVKEMQVEIDSLRNTAQPIVRKK